MKKRLFVDMDGTLTEFIPTKRLEDLYEENYFRDLRPLTNVVSAISKLTTHPDFDVYILSAYLTDSRYALKEKNEWLDEFLPEIPLSNRLFVPCGAEKKDHIPEGMNENDFLLDDYTKNLSSWDAGKGTGIKLINGINDTQKTWQGMRVSAMNINKENFAENLLNCLNQQEKTTRLKEDLQTDDFKKVIIDRTKPRQKQENIRYDIDRINEIPIQDLIEEFAVKKGRDGKYSIRPEDKTPSLKLYPDTNSFFDFGSSVGGGVIQLTRMCMNKDFPEALEYLSHRYGIPPLNQNVTVDFTKHKMLTDREYEKIGISGDHAGKNVSFDFEKYTHEQNLRLSKKLAIPMNELFEKHPESYTKILQERAIPTVLDARNKYLHQLYFLSNDEVKKDSLEYALSKSMADDQYKEYKTTYKSLERAAEGTNLNIVKMKPNFKQDLENVSKGKQPIEIGDYPYREYKQLSGGNCYLTVSEKEYQLFDRFAESGNFNYPHSVFLQKGNVNIVHKEVDTLEFEGIFKTIRQSLDSLQNTKEEKQSQHISQDEIEL